MCLFLPLNRISKSNSFNSSRKCRKLKTEPSDEVIAICVVDIWYAIFNILFSFYEKLLQNVLNRGGYQIKFTPIKKFFRKFDFENLQILLQTILNASGCPARFRPLKIFFPESVPEICQIFYKAKIRHVKHAWNSFLALNFARVCIIPAHGYKY